MTLDVYKRQAYACADGNGHGNEYQGGDRQILQVIDEVCKTCLLYTSSIVKKVQKNTHSFGENPCQGFRVSL